MAYKRSSTVPVGQVIDLDDDPDAPCEWFVYGHVTTSEAHAAVTAYQAAQGRACPPLGAVVHGQARWCPRTEIKGKRAGRAFRYVDDPNTSEGAFKTTRVTTEEATAQAEREALALALRAAHVQRFVWEMFPESMALRAECGKLGDLQSVSWSMTGLENAVTMSLDPVSMAVSPPVPSADDAARWAQLYSHRFAAWQLAQLNLDDSHKLTDRGLAAARGLPLFDLVTHSNQAPTARRRADRGQSPSTGADWLTTWVRRLLGTEAAWARVDEAARRLATMIAEPGWAPRVVMQDAKVQTVAAAMADRNTARLLLTLDAPFSALLYKRAVALCEGVGDHGLAVAITWEGLRAPCLTPTQRAELEGLRSHNLQKQAIILHASGHR